MLPASPGSEDTRCDARKAEASLRTQKRSALPKIQGGSLRRHRTAPLRRGTEPQPKRVKQPHGSIAVEKRAAASQFGKGFSEYSKFRLQQSECSFLLSLAVSERTPRWFNYVLGGRKRPYGLCFSSLRFRGSVRWETCVAEYTVSQCLKKGKLGL